MISLIKATFEAPLRVISQGFEATVQSVGPFAFLVGVAFSLAGCGLLAKYLETEVDR